MIRARGLRVRGSAAADVRRAPGRARACAGRAPRHRVDPQRPRGAHGYVRGRPRGRRANCLPFDTAGVARRCAYVPRQPEPADASTTLREHLATGLRGSGVPLSAMRSRTHGRLAVFDALVTALAAGSPHDRAPETPLSELHTSRSCGRPDVAVATRGRAPLVVVDLSRVRVLRGLPWRRSWAQADSTAIARRRHGCRCAGRPHRCDPGCLRIRRRRGGARMKRAWTCSSPGRGLRRLAGRSSSSPSPRSAPLVVVLALVPARAGQTVPVALVNQDVPITSGSTPVAAGKLLTLNLISNDTSVDWVLTDPATAERGALTDGDYLAVVTIPSDFSANVATLSSSASRADAAGSRDERAARLRRPSRLADALSAALRRACRCS